MIPSTTDPLTLALFGEARRADAAARARMLTT